MAIAGARLPVAGSLAQRPAQPRRLAELVRPVLEELAAEAGLADEALDRFWDTFELLTRESLQLPLAGPLPRFSGICRDGTPWQYCIVLAPGVATVRYLTEIGQPGIDFPTRVALSRRRLEMIFARLGFASDACVLDSLTQLLPEQPPVDAVGGFWVGVGASPSGLRLRIYANCGWGSELERWRRVAGCLRELQATAFQSTLRELAQLLVPTFSPAGLAVTVPESSRSLKLYLRPRSTPWRDLPRLLERVVGPEGASRLLGAAETALDRQLETLPAHALVLSLAMESAGGALDTKLDLCGHCLFGDDDARARVTVDALARDLGLETRPYEHALAAISGAGSADGVGSHAFLGLGFDPARGARVNVYLRPPVRSRAPRLPEAGSSPPRPSHGDVLARASGYLLAAASGGVWSDFHLPVGSSTSWVSAYVANALLDLRDAALAAREGWSAELAERAQHACAAAARVLLSSYAAGRGWGYNEDTEPDADSTAFAVLFLRRLGVRTPPPNALLSHYRNPDGGYATFAGRAPDDCWGHSHADVTPTALRALSGRQLTKEQARALLSSRQGLFWRSYWWRSDLYATEANLRLLAPDRHREEYRPIQDYLLATDPPANPFEAALLLRSLCHLPPGASVSRSRLRLLRVLLEQQELDGAWPPGAWLRLTYPGCAQPWAAPDSSGPLYLDDGVFTTATAVSALATTIAQADV